MRGRRSHKGFNVFGFFLYDATQSFDFEDILSKLAGVQWCVLLGNVGEVVEGKADGVSKFGPEEHAKRVQEFVPIGRFIVEKASPFLDDVGKVHNWFIALFKAQEEGESVAPFWPQTTPCLCSGLRGLAERMKVIDVASQRCPPLGSHGVAPRCAVSPTVPRHHGWHCLVVKPAWTLKLNCNVVDVR